MTAAARWLAMFVTGAMSLVIAATPFAQSAPRFDVASVKPSPPLPPRGAIVRSGSAQPGGRWIAQNARFMDILRSVYREYPLRNQIVGGPDWITRTRFDIDARVEGDPSAEQMTLMVKQLLADRFALKVHPEQRELPVYALVLARSDGRLEPGLRPVAVDCQPVLEARARGEAGPILPDGRRQCSVATTEENGILHLAGRAIGISALITMIQGTLATPIVDRTGLTGVFDVDLELAIDTRLSASPDAPPDSADAPSVFVAVQHQLGLKLEPRRETMDVLVIDHVEMPEAD